MNIIIKKYEHFNRSLGKQIRSKAHYEKEMRKQGMVSWEEGQRIAQKAREKASKPYSLSNKADEVIRAAKDMTHNGKINVEGRLIKAMEDVGLDFTRRKPDAA